MARRRKSARNLSGPASKVPAEDGTSWKKLRYIQSFRDRYGKVRYYFRRRGWPHVALPGAPGSPEFMEAYWKAYCARKTGTPKHRGNRVAPGTVAAAIIRYFNSDEYSGLAQETRRTWRYGLDPLRKEFGNKRFSSLKMRHVYVLLDSMTGKPWKARNFLKAFRSFMGFCVARGLCLHDPSVGIKLRRIKTNGYWPWTDELIERFRARHPLGTRERLVLEMVLNTGARCADLSRLGPQNLSHSEFRFETHKTQTRVSAMPLLPLFADVLEATPTGDRTFLVTRSGKPFTPKTLSNFFRKARDRAGIPKGYTLHGLRVTLAICYAEAGATEHQLQAWFGWETLRSAERYTRRVNREKLTRSLGELIKKAIAVVKPSLDTSSSLTILRPNYLKIQNPCGGVVGDTGLEPVTPAM